MNTIGQSAHHQASYDATQTIARHHEAQEKARWVELENLNKINEIKRNNFTSKAITSTTNINVQAIPQRRYDHSKVSAHQESKKTNARIVYFNMSWMFDWTVGPVFNGCRQLELFVYVIIFNWMFFLFYHYVYIDGWRRFFFLTLSSFQTIRMPAIIENIEMKIIHICAFSYEKQDSHVLFYVFE